MAKRPEEMTLADIFVGHKVLRIKEDEDGVTFYLDCGKSVQIFSSQGALIVHHLPS